MTEDKELLLIKEIKNIKKLQNELREIREDLSRTRCDIAGLTLLLFGNYFYSKIEKHPLNTQFIADIADIFSKIDTSDDPLTLVNEFQKKYNGILEKLGIISHLTIFHR